MRTFRRYFVFLAGVLLIWACTKSNPQPTKFDIVGKWGALSVTYTWPDKEADYFAPQGNSYYNYWTFQINGALIYESEPDHKKKYGDYVYNENTKKLTYIYDGYRYYVNADVIDMSPTEMVITADLGPSVGKTIYRLIKLEW